MKRIHEFLLKHGEKLKFVSWIIMAISLSVIFVMAALALISDDTESTITADAYTVQSSQEEGINLPSAVQDLIPASSGIDVGLSWTWIFTVHAAYFDSAEINGYFLPQYDFYAQYAVSQDGSKHYTGRYFCMMTTSGRMYYFFFQESDIGSDGIYMFRLKDDFINYRTIDWYIQYDPDDSNYTSYVDNSFFVGATQYNPYGGWAGHIAIRIDRFYLSGLSDSTTPLYGAYGVGGLNTTTPFQRGVVALSSESLDGVSLVENLNTSTVTCPVLLFFRPESYTYNATNGANVTPYSYCSLSLSGMGQTIFVGSDSEDYGYFRTYPHLSVVPSLNTEMEYDITTATSIFDTAVYQSYIQYSDGSMSDVYTWDPILLQSGLSFRSLGQYWNSIAADGVWQRTYVTLTFSVPFVYSSNIIYGSGNSTNFLNTVTVIDDAAKQYVFSWAGPDALHQYELLPSENINNNVVVAEISFWVGGGFDGISELTWFVQDTYYANAFENGYIVGQENGYNDGLTAGSNIGYDNGFLDGYDAGLIEGGDYTFTALLGAVIDAPVRVLTSLLDFEILGFNLKSIFMALLTLLLAVVIWKKLKG